MSTADITSLVIQVKSDGIKEASNALGGLSTSAGNATKRIDSLVTAMSKLDAISRLSASAATQTSAFTQALNQVATANNHVANSFTQSKQKLIEQKRETELHNIASKAYAAAQAEAIKMNNALDAARKTNTGSLRLHNNAMRESHALARGLSGSLGALWMTYGSLTGMAVGVGIGASLKGILTVGKDVEHTLETLRVKGGETVESANKMREAIYSIGQGIYGPQEVVKALEVLVLAGLNATQAMAALRPALNLATAGGTDIKTAAEGLVTIGTAVGASAEHYTMLADGITTAANISLASVESITNTVKRASVVNKLYGASFEDILIQASALANLGIKDTAAGTAITNFYSDMQGKSEKAKKALAELGVSFSDANGRAKPLVEMMKDFNGALTGFKMPKQKELIMDIFGERSKRDVVATTSMIRSAATETGKYGSKLEEVAGAISNMAGASSLAAAQIALTTENQIKSMNNTLKTTLAKTFTELEPQVNVFTAKMKEAFNSPQFAAALVTISSAVAGLAVGFVNNIQPLTMIVAGMVAFKLAVSGMAIASALTGPLMAAATAFGATAVSAGGAAVATGAFGTAIRLLPFVGLAAGIATVIGALIMYKFHMAGAKNSAIETAEAYRTNYLDALKDEADQIKRTTDNLAAGLPLMKAQTLAIKEQALGKAQLNNENAIAAAQSDLDKEKQGFEKAYGPDYLKMAEKNGKLPPVIKQLTDELNRQKAASDNFTIQAHLRATTIVNGSETIRQAYKKEQAAAEAAAKAAAGKNSGAGAVDLTGEKDSYKATLTRIRGDVEAGKRELNTLEELVNNKFKAGLITEFDKIAQISDGRLKELANEIQSYADMVNLSAPGNQKNARAQVENDLYAAQYNYRAEAEKRASQNTLAFERMEEGVFLTRQKRLTLEGRNEEAAVEKYERLYGNQIKAAQNYLTQELLVNDALESGDAEKIRRVALMAEALKAMEEATASGISDGKMTDATDATNKALNQMRTEIDAVVSAVPSGGLLAGIAGDQEIDRIQQRAIPELERLYQVQLKLARLSNAPGDIKAAALAGEELRKLKKGVGGDDAWTGAQESLRKYGTEAAEVGNQINHVMTNAFKGAEDALVSFVQTGKLDFKSLANSIIADLVRISIRQAMGATMGAGSSSSAGLLGALISIGGAVFGGGGATAGGTSYALGSGAAASSTLGSGLQFRAAGGPVNAGESYIVGEKGMEVFEPTVSGNIIPNHSLSSAKGGSSDSGNTTVVYSPTISIDSRTDQAEVRQLVSNAVRQGNSELVETLSRQGRI